MEDFGELVQNTAGNIIRSTNASGIKVIVGIIRRGMIELKHDRDNQYEIRQEVEGKNRRLTETNKALVERNIRLEKEIKE